MPTVVLAPTTFAQWTSGWTAQPSGTLLGVVTDGDTATYARSATLGSGWEIARLRFPEVSIPAGARISAVRVLYSVRTIATSGIYSNFDLWASRSNSGLGRQEVDIPVLGTNVHVRTSPWQTAAPTGESWTPQLVDGLFLWFRFRRPSGSTATQQGAIAEVAIEVEYNERPTVTLDALGTITDTSAPTSTWVYADPEGDAQEAFRPKLTRVSDGAVVHDPGWIISTATQYQWPTVDNDESYVAEITVRQPWAGEGIHASAPDTDTFTLDLVTPAPPSVLTIVYDDDAMVTLELDDTTLAPDPIAEWFSVEHHDGDGNWTPLRGGQHLDAAEAPLIVVDYEAPFGTERTYRARAHTAAAGQTVSSDPTGATASLNSTGRWLTDVRDPSRLHTSVEAREHGRTWHGRDQVDYPAGMDIAVVTSEPTVAHQTLAFWSLDREQHDLLVAGLRSTRPLLYRDHRTHMYFRWYGDRVAGQLGPDVAEVDALTGSMVEIQRPT